MYIKIAIYLILTVSGLLFFKIGGNGINMSVNMQHINMSIPAIALLGIMCYGFSFLLWLNIVKENHLSYIYPVVNGIVTIMTVCGGIIVFKERVGLIQWIGIGTIILGVVLVNLSK